MKSLEWMLAGRYLRLLKLRSLRVYLLPAIFLGLLLAGRLALLYLERHQAAFLFSPMYGSYLSWLRVYSLGTLVMSVFWGFLMWLVRRYTIFTSISTFGLFLGSAALVIVVSVMSGFEQDLKHKILGANAHILVTEPDLPFNDYEKVADTIRKVKGVESVTPYLSNEVMISSQANLAGVVLQGIDPATAAKVTDLSKNLTQGSFDNLLHPEKLRDISGPPGFDDDLPPSPDDKPDIKNDGKPAIKNDELHQDDSRKDDGNKDTLKKNDAKEDKKTVDFMPLDSHGHPVRLPQRPGPARRILPGVLIGQELAKNLRLYLGDDVNLVSPMGDIGPAGPMPKSRPFRVAGIFYSGMYEYDSKHIYLSIPAAQKFLGMNDEVTGVEVRITDPDESEKVTRAIEVALDDHQFDVEDWKELNRNLFSALKIEKLAMSIFLCFIILVAGFSIVANGIMLVREKEKEIAILKSMGATNGTIMKTFLLIGLHMGVLGVASGIATGVSACMALARFGLTLDTDVYYISKLPVDLNPSEIVVVFFAAILIALSATIYPALMAARLRPVESL